MSMKGDGKEPGAVPVVLAITLVALALTTAFAAHYRDPGLSRDFFVQQDGPLAIVSCVVLAAMIAAHRVRLRAIAWEAVGDRQLFLAIAGVVLALWAATYLVMENYALSRDEQMVLFDAAIFRSGHLAALLPPAWRDFANALNPLFLLDIPGNAYWVSAYMPVNAAIRALASLCVDPALVGPVLAGIGAIALLAIARRSFPGDKAAVRVALLLYLTSAQMLATAMTPFAMTGHMALNLVWLALFLRRDRLGHVGAIATGFLATGLHQIAFHPLFVLPFLDQLRRERRWRSLGTYIVAYGLIGLFWMSYQGLLVRSLGITSPGGATAGIGGFFVARVLSVFAGEDGRAVLMADNLVRFATWQNLALIPLVLLAVPLAWRREGIAAPLLAGIVLTTVAMAVVMPFQGYGWGYRYVHGLLGSAALLGAYGWRSLDRRVADTLLATGTAFTLCIGLPFLLWQAHATVAPFAEFDRRLSRIDADFAVIDTGPDDVAGDVVRNDPFLRNRPLRFSSLELTRPLLARLCAAGTVSFVGVDTMPGIVPRGVTRRDTPETRLPSTCAKD